MTISKARMCSSKIYFVLSGSLSWNGDVLATGSKDHSIALTDHRTSCPQPQNKLTGHRQEVGGYLMIWRLLEKKIKRVSNEFSAACVHISSTQFLRKLEVIFFS